MVRNKDYDSVVKQSITLQNLDNTPELFVHARYAGIIIGQTPSEQLDIVAASIFQMRHAGNDRIDIQPFIQSLVLVGHQFIPRVRRIHGNHHGKRLAGAFPAFYVFNGQVGFIFRPPLVYIIKILPPTVGIPIHRPQVLVIGSICHPIVESVPSLRRTPFIPGHFASVVGAVNIGLHRLVQMPLSDVCHLITFRFQDVRPTNHAFLQFHILRCRFRLTIGNHSVAMGISSGKEHASGRRRNGITTHSLSKDNRFTGKGIKIWRPDSFFSAEAQRISSELIGHHHQQIGRRVPALCMKRRT